MGEPLSRDDVVTLIRQLSRSARDGNAEWNLDTVSYLETVSAWTEDLDGSFANNGAPVPEPSWELDPQARTRTPPWRSR